MPRGLDVEVLPPPAGPLIVEGRFDPAIELSLVVPTYNESENIAEFLRAVKAVLDGALAGRYEVIVVDDDSPDRTWEIAARAMGDAAEFRVIRHQSDRGLAAAVIRGWLAARGRVLGTINADFQHPPEVLSAMVAALGAADVVAASRYGEGGGLGDWGLHRRLASRVAHGLGRLLLPEVFGRLSDPLSGCYLVKRAVIAGTELHPVGYKTLIEIMIRGRAATVAECGYHMRARRFGKSKAGARQGLDFVRHLLRLRAAARAGGVPPR
jgi:dolichol-phosphate mannosyltransferase